MAENTTSDNAVVPGNENDSTRAARRPRRRPTVSAKQMKDGSDAVRSRIASVVWIVAVVCALILAIGALLVALPAQESNPIVDWVTHTASALAGPFGGLHHGIFDFQQKSGGDDVVKNALANWGLAAMFYLVVGRVADRIIRP